ncbi:hypothetical protein [Salegentibacter sp. Hel_I_6]|nr:hypothetical protein [Salegentibacter sp. Hel_I_6]
MIIVLFPGIHEIEVLDNVLVPKLGSVRLPDCLFCEKLLRCHFQ